MSSLTATAALSKSFIDIFTMGMSKNNNSLMEPHNRRSYDFTAVGKTVRQKTDGSFGESEELDRNGMRRTSSMPSVCEPVIPSSSGPSLRHYDYDGKLNKLQKKALRFTWHRLQTRNGGKRVEQVFEEVFDRLVRQVPQVREMFTTRMFLCAMNRHETASLRDHSRAIVRMIDVVIKNLEVERLKRTDTASEMDPRLIGRSHGSLRPYGMTGNYWEKLGETIVDVVLAQEAVRDLPGAGQAWVILAACLVDQLRAGFDETRFTQNQGILNKQGTVLHHATQHLNRDMSIDENHIEECPMAMSSHSPPSPPPILDEGCRRQSRPRTEEASA
ncbi:unnamed protein product, partial [Mesorhabditis belari]|uniref:Globin family profile domain-containing protein n=1 Tax=Mesorhabditis belari TaxID=2138241 RepID=A0AAF3FKG9_9BILA